MTKLHSLMKGIESTWFILADFFKILTIMDEKQLRAELDAVYSSLSWRITAPLRYLSLFVRSYLLRPLSPRFWFRVLTHFLVSRPKLLGFVKRLLSHVPGLHGRMQRLAHQVLLNEQIVYVAPKLANLDELANANLPPLSSQAALIYREVQRSLKRKA